MLRVWLVNDLKSKKLIKQSTVKLIWQTRCNIFSFYCSIDKLLMNLIYTSTVINVRNFLQFKQSQRLHDYSLFLVIYNFSVAYSRKDK